MGACLGKSAIDANSGGKLAVENQNRRRLSLSQSAQAVPAKDESFRGRMVTADSIMDLFPKSGRRLSMAGTLSSKQQRGFENKSTNCSDETVTQKIGELGIGVSCRKGLKPESPNQDDFCILSVDDFTLFGVFDGHGPCGHDISNYVQSALPLFIVSDSDFLTDTEAVCARAFKKTQERCEELSRVGKFDCSLSGTTVTVVIHFHSASRSSEIVIAHVGDSRCVLASRMKNVQDSSVHVQDLSVDHKPELPNEKARIEAKGGQVRKLEGDIPHRVFLHKKFIPGLAMSRSLGDAVGMSAGVVSTPDTRTVKIPADEKVMILICSDGVWEFISSEEGANIAWSQSTLQLGANTLAQNAWNRWIQEEGNVVDDITVICCELN